MQINITDSINFQSRNKTIRFADDLVRKVNQNYTLISPTRVACFDNIGRFYYLKSRLNTKISMLRQDEYRNFLDSKDMVDKILATVIPIKRYNVANCGEYGQLSCFAAKVNGIENCYLAGLYNHWGLDLDHTVLYVEGKKPYIIDAWLGFADYLPNATVRYKNEFRKYFDHVDDNTEIRFRKINGRTSKFLNEIVSNKQINKLKQLFPELIINKKQK